ncbi:MAG: orotidine-5'-phosphate decarboxylase [Longimicrobiales bacterium]
MSELIVALDVPGAVQALRLVERLGDDAHFYKVGSQLYTAEGPELVRELGRRGKRVFLDLKYHDIPHTVARAVEAAASMDVQLLTLHVSGGAAMLRAALDAAGEDGPRLLGVTLLTSLSAAEVEDVWARELRSMGEEVARLTALAAEAGLHGVVASALEADALKRRHGAGFLVVTPGIRPAGGPPNDQVRTATPAQAASAGADFIVVGRPILAAPEPAAVARAIRMEMDAALAAPAT